MKFSAILLATLAASTTQAFAPSRPVVSIKTLAAATLEAPTESAASSEDVPPPVVAETVSAEMAVEKDWPVDQENFVKDSDRIEP